MTRSFRDLLVWQRSMSLAELCYQLSATLPTAEEFGLKSQIRRAAVSIPSNIAEGQGKRYNGEFLRHLLIAMGSLSELETQIELAIRVRLLRSEDSLVVLKGCEEVGKLLHGLARSVRKKNRPLFQGSVATDN